MSMETGSPPTMICLLFQDVTRFGSSESLITIVPKMGIIASMTLQKEGSIGGLIRRWEVPRQEVVDPALLVSVDDRFKRIGEIGLRVDGIELAGLDQ
jgi:hypothetical protein